MSDQHLRFNPQTMHYEVVYKKHSRWRNVLYVLLVGIAFGLLFILLGTTFIKSKDVRKKEHDLAVFKETYEKAELQYQQNIELLRNLELQDRHLFREIFETDPPDTTLLSNQLLEESQNNSHSAEFSGMLSLVKARYSKIENIAYKDAIRIDFAGYFLKNNADYIHSLPIRVPLKEGSYSLVSGFGKRIHPIFKTARQHNGLDLAARAGTEVLASGDGVVQEVPKNLAGYGTMVYIYHGHGYYSLYAQLLESKVDPGSKVSAGDVIGFVGSTGISIGPHLHYEIWKDGKPVDPIRYLLTVDPKEYLEMFKVASQYNQCLS
ncbi:MAG: hypothetical protein A2W93_10820 [Bacteroidetes bacterium GWF2_43_63]|nr:MAG: hypothetical protein A2W94_00320 [Bacteroidetes bacterium GWE2_42_42]OFY56406.1 MAG: hypothetical protein A2W93_10820 [Bacteroidetes bacterium GWF2_43_63]